MTKKCLITGASGLIGSSVVQLFPNDWTVYGISRKQPSLEHINTKTYHHLPLDFTEDWNTASLPPKVDAVIHMAQSEHFRDFPDAAPTVFKVNIDSTLQLLDYARKAGAKTFILASSGGIYGSGDQEFSEESEISAKNDLGFYLSTKLSAEILANNYTPYMDVIILRFFFVYGPKQRRAMLIPRLVESVKEGRPIHLQGENGICINPIYVDDAANAIKQALLLEGSHKINIGGTDVLSLRQICETIGQKVGKKPFFETDMNAESRHLIGDIQNMRNLLNIHPRSFDKGIEQYIQHCLAEVVC